MSEHFFGSGRGVIPARTRAKADRIAAAHGATLVPYYDPGCGCGRGHRSRCPALARYWFAAPNRGEPFDGRVAAAVKRDLAAAGLDIAALGTTARPRKNTPTRARKAARKSR